jgi:hypothetical protein
LGRALADEALAEALVGALVTAFTPNASDADVEKSSRKDA